jgi:hypothetical protein
VNRNETDKTLMWLHSGCTPILCIIKRTNRCWLWYFKVLILTCVISCQSVCPLIDLSLDRRTYTIRSLFVLIKSDSGRGHVISTWCECGKLSTIAFFPLNFHPLVTLPSKYTPISVLKFTNYNIQSLLNVIKIFFLIKNANMNILF